MKMDSDRGEFDFERAISYVLITGVVFSLTLEVIGIATFYGSYGHLHVSESASYFLHGRDFLSFLLDLFRGGYSREYPILLMALGIAVLVLTPYVRVVLSVVHFMRVGNGKYVAITLFVLVLLTTCLVVVPSP